jgi:hypothetical protein
LSTPNVSASGNQGKHEFNGSDKKIATSSAMPYRFGGTFACEYVDVYKGFNLDSGLSFTYSPVLNERFSIFK